MRLSEVLLRIGSCLAAWMIIYAYFIWLAVVNRVDCSVDGDEIFRVLLGMAPIAAGASFLLRGARPFPDIHQMLRWLGIPVLLLLLLTLPIIWQVFTQVNLNDGAICLGGTQAGWHSYWAPLQAIATGVCVYAVLRTWRSATSLGNDGVAD